MLDMGYEEAFFGLAYNSEEMTGVTVMGTLLPSWIGDITARGIRNRTTRTVKKIMWNLTSM